VNKEAWDLFQEDDARLYIAKHPPQVRPEVAGVICSASLARHTVRLAGDSPIDKIHASTPGSPVEGLEVIPYRGGAKVAAAHPGLQDTLAVGVRFDIADGAGYSCGLEGPGADSASGTYIQAMQYLRRGLQRVALNHFGVHIIVLLR